MGRPERPCTGGTSLGGRAEGTGHWVAVAVADRDETDEVRLLAVVTQEAPP
ncbi:putative protein OS=Streptomyces tendae OX=1932 GN=GUR47_29855 PE=4 SV=1 [Streptomyces tendae]